MSVDAVKDRFGIWRSQFARNVLTMATGSAAAQLIAIAFTPVITRLYGPHAYGLQGLFVSVVTVLSTAAALTYPTAIVLPQRNEEARALARLSILAGVAAAGLVFVVLYFYGQHLLALLNATAVEPFVFWIPAAIVLTVLATVWNQWLVRHHAFTHSARASVLTAAVVSACKTGVGLVHPSAAALIVTNLLGELLGLAMNFLGWRKLSGSARHRGEGRGGEDNGAVSLWQAARRYRDFPLLRAPQDLINAFSQSLPVLLLAAYFTPAAAGHYAIAIAVLNVPAGLIGGSVSSVFYPRITEAVANGEDAPALIRKATAAMALSGVLPFACVILGGPSLFGFVFGKEWAPAGQYAQWLAAWIFFQYINRPAVAAVPALRLQGGLLVYELFSTGSKVLALWIGFAVYKDPLVAVGLFSMAGVVAYACLITWVIRRSDRAQLEAQRT